MERTRAACPVSRLTPFAAESSKASSTVAGSRTRPSVRPRGRDETLLGSQNPGGSEQIGSGNRVHTRTVGPTQHRRLANAVIWPSQGQRPGLQHLGDEQLDQLIDHSRGHPDGPYVALRFGADMPDLPGRTPFLHRRQHFLRSRRHPLRIHPWAHHRDRTEGLADHGLDRIRCAECFTGLGMPGGALLGLAAGFVLGIPGFLGRLLRQLLRLHRRRRPTMITLKPARQLTLPNLDQHPPGRPPLVQRGIDTDNLPHRRLPRSSV